MASVRVEVLLGVGHGALVDGAVLSGGKVVHVLLAVSGEVNRQTASVNEGHAAALLLDLGTGIHVLLVGVSLALQLHEFVEFKSLLHGPFNDAAIT